jgi:hypothetical protein
MICPGIIGCLAIGGAPAYPESARGGLIAKSRICPAHGAPSRLAMGARAGCGCARARGALTKEGLDLTSGFARCP